MRVQATKHFSHIYIVFEGFRGINKFLVCISHGLFSLRCVCGVEIISGKVHALAATMNPRRNIINTPLAPTGTKETKIQLSAGIIFIFCVEGARALVM